MAGGPFATPWRRRRRPAPGALVPTAPAAPDTPSSPNPANAATAYYALLSWVSARATKFDIYLDTVNPPTTIVAPKYNTTAYVPTLAGSTTYYWKVVAFNDGGSATGPVWSFTTPAATAVLFALAGSVVTSHARAESLSVHEVLGSAPNIAGVIFDTPPTDGASIQIGLGTLDADHLLFGGQVQGVDQTCIGTPAASSIYPATLIDQTFVINKRRPFGTWTNVSASTIARYLVATFAPGFTSTHVADGLPAMTITFDGSQDFMSCLRALATAIGTPTNPGKTKVDYAKDVWLYLSNTDDRPDPVDATHPPLQNPAPIRFAVDHSQLRTKVYGKGHGEALLSEVVRGETILPIADAVMFNPAGGQAIASTTADGAQSQILTYTGIQASPLAGTLIGPGAAPTVAPSVARVFGTQLGVGTYQYAYTDVTAAGESLPSPLGAIVTGTGTIDPPATAPTATDVGSGGTHAWVEGDYLYFSVTFVTASGETTHGPTTATPITTSGGSNRVDLTNIPLGPTGTTKRRIYREQSVGSAKSGNVYLSIEIGDNTTTTVVDINNGGTPTVGTLYSTSGQVGPATNTATLTLQNVNVSAIAIGPAGVTQRKLYRTIVNGSQLKLLTTLADNTTTTFADSTVDGSLGANAPVTDTSTLTQPAGQVNAGSTSLPVANGTLFNSATGGWVALAGDQAVRYTGVSGNTLTGIPPTGPGAILTTVLNGSQVLPAPVLLGINNANGVPVALAKGAAVNIWVERNDLAAQAALGQLERDSSGNATDGIREYLIVDERSTEARMIALCDADLTLFARPIVTAQYYTRDRKSKPGRTVSIALTDGVAPWGQTGDFTIQRVELSFDGPALNPLYQVTATSVAFTLSDLLRRVLIAA